MNLLAIPNDETASYENIPESDFINEFNPLEFFDNVFFLNWRDKIDCEYCGIKSFSIIKNKQKIKNTFDRAVGGHTSFTYPLFYPFFLEEEKDILEKANQTQAQLIRAFNTHFSAELGIFLKKRLGIPLIVSAHDIKRLTNAVKEADYLICVSEALSRKAIEEYGINPSKISLIPDGIDMDFFYPREKEEISKFIDLNSKYKILSVGRVVPGKNIETLLKSIKLIYNELKDVSHVHLGGGSKANLEKIISLKEDLGLSEVSHFLGKKRKEELPFFYSWADVYSLPTLHEGLGRASIEALACGTPVVTTNYPPMTEVIQEEYNGLTANPNNPGELSSQIFKILTNNKLKKTLTRNARISVLDKYNIKDTVKDTVELYEEILYGNI